MQVARSIDGLAVLHHPGLDGGIGDARTAQQRGALLSERLGKAVLVDVGLLGRSRKRSRDDE